MRPDRHSVVAIAATAAVAAAAGGWVATAGSAPDARRIPQATTAQLRAAGLSRLALAPPSKRVDLDVPAFSNPTRITNPFFPISSLHSAILSGRVDGKAFKTETTLLPYTRIIEWPEGRPVEAAISQYVAYLDGRLEEVALDYYAQADDGSVWYLGEDVFNYADDGAIADRGGTWLAGREGPAAMIMPALPKVGDTYRSENVPGLVFEEVTTGAVGRTVAGPRGPVAGAIIARELHQDGAVENKTFAPGYGEFFTGGGGDVEAMSLAVPIDAVEGAVPRPLETILAGARSALSAAGSARWDAVDRASARIRSASVTLTSQKAPPRLAKRLDGAVDGLSAAAKRRNGVGASRAAIAVAQAALDVELRHRPPAQIDRARFGWWARRLAVDTAAGHEAEAMGDLAALEWIRDRFWHTLTPIGRTRVDAALVELRSRLNDGEVRHASATASSLAQLVAP